MPTPSYPGVYVQEVPSGVRPLDRRRLVGREVATRLEMPEGGYVGAFALVATNQTVGCAALPSTRAR